MSSRGKGLMDCLSRQDMKLLNIKFFRGSNEHITEEQLESEICAAAERQRLGEVVPGRLPKWRHERVDVREYVAKL